MGWTSVGPLLRRFLAALLMVAVLVPVATSPVHANSQERATETSARTGVTYTGVHSCVRTSPSFRSSSPTRDVEMRIVFTSNDASRNFTQTYTLASGSPLRAFAMFNTNITVEFDDDPTWLIQDRLAGDAAYVDVMRITPTGCPSYEADPTSTFTAINPERVLDTRPAQRTNYTGSKPATGAVVGIPASVMPDRPAGTTAVSVTLTVAQPAATGFAQVFPQGVIDVASVSNVNVSGPDQTAANSAVVPVAADGSISVYTSTSAHLIVDVNGYFVEQSGAVSAGRLETTATTRMLDTRPTKKINSNGTKPADGSILTLDLTTLNSGLPAGATAAVVNVTATRSTARGFVQAAAGGSLVPGESSVLNLTGADQTVAGLSIVPLSATGTIDLFVSESVDLVVDLSGWFTGATAVASTTGLFVPLAPERIYDTRLNSFVGSEFCATSGQLGCMDDSIGIRGLDGRQSALLLNATSIRNQGVGFLELGDLPRGETSNVNWVADGSIVANAALVPTPNDRLLVLRSRTSITSVAVDLFGYFTI